MNSFSNVVLVGRLTRNAEIKNTQTGNSVVSFSLAIDRRKRGLDGNLVDDTIYVDVSYFSQNAMSICPFLEKGVQVGVTGELNQRKWVANDGTNQSKLEVRANNVHLIESKEATELRKNRQTGMPSTAASATTQAPKTGNFTRASVNFSQPAARLEAPAVPNFGPDSFDDDQDVPF